MYVVEFLYEVYRSIVIMITTTRDQMLNGFLTINCVVQQLKLYCNSCYIINFCNGYTCRAHYIIITSWKVGQVPVSIVHRIRSVIYKLTLTLFTPTLLQYELIYQGYCMHFFLGSRCSMAAKAKTVTTTCIYEYHW